MDSDEIDELIEWLSDMCDGQEMAAQHEMCQSNKDYCARESDRARDAAQALREYKQAMFALGRIEAHSHDYKGMSKSMLRITMQVIHEESRDYKQAQQQGTRKDGLLRAAEIAKEMDCVSDPYHKCKNNEDIAELILKEAESE